MSVTDPSRGRGSYRRWLVILGMLAAVGFAWWGWQWVLTRTMHRPIVRSPLEAEALRSLGTPGRASGYNLLLITIDTVRADRLGCYGYTRAQTPNIDRLTDHGVQLLQAIAPAPLTLPSHSTIMTGLDVPAHGARDNGSFHLSDDKLTLAEVLDGRGYATAAFVAAYVLDARYGLDQGFATYDQNVNPDRSQRSAGHFNERPADAVTNAAITWFDGRDAETRERPFFAWVHYFDAHGPYEPPREYAERFAHPYDGEIAFVDAQIGRLLTHLNQDGSLERTLVILAADHGEALGEHGEETHSRLIYDSTMHVPLMLSCPTLFPQRVTVDDRIVSLADIFPTALDLLGVDWDAPIDGVNLLTTPPDRKRAIYIETMAPLLNNGWASLHGLRRLNDKYILAPRPEYYDLLADPAEHDNLYDSASAPLVALVSELDKRLQQWDLPESVLAEAAPLDPEQIRRLAALGYVRADFERNVSHLDPKDALPIWQDMMRAQAMSNAGRHEKAATQMRKVLKENPHDAQAWQIAALIHQRLERWDDAERSLQQSIELRPTAECYVRLAQLMLRRGSAAEADRALDEAMLLDPLDGQIFITRGDRLAMVGRFAEALSEFERALEVDPIRVGALAREKIQAAKQRGQRP